METELKSNELLAFLSSSGLVEAKRNDIAQSLGMFFDKASEWNQTIASIVITDPSETGKMKMAKEGRLTLKNMRLDAMKVVKAKRESVKNRMADDILEDKLLLKAGQMVEATFENLEGKLQEKEEFGLRWEAENKAKLKIARDAEVLPFAEFVLGGIDLSNLSETDYQKFLGGLKLQMEAKLEAEAKIKAEKEAKEKAEREERERIALENSRLKAEAIEAENKRIAEKAEADRILKAEQAQKAKELAESKAEADRILKAEQAQKAKELAESKAKADAEAKLAKEKADIEAKRLKAESDAKLAEQRAKYDADIKEGDRLRIEREAKAKAEREIVNAEKAKVDAENARLKAEKEKFDKEAREKKELEAIEAKKKEGQAHKSKILGDAKQSFIDNGYSEEEAKKIVLLIKDLKIKNVSINY